MIIFVSTQGTDLTSQVEPRFGRSPHFIRFDSENQSFQAFDNDAAEQSGGAGVAAAQFLIDHGANAAISGRFGPNAHQVLAAGGIAMWTFADEHQSVQDVLKAFEAGTLTSAR